MPSVLLELGFMDSATDTPIILSDTFADQCANAIVEYLVESYGLKKKVVPKPPVADTVLPDGKFFRVIVGSYSSRNNAVEMQEKLKKAGFDSFLAIYEK
jgi:N-acetylmuramoyl-L-alanine amidase